MACCQGRCFIQEEQEGVPTWGHHLAMTAFEVQDAGYPDAVGEGLDDPALGVVALAGLVQRESAGVTLSILSRSPVPAVPVQRLFLSSAEEF